MQMQMTILEYLKQLPEKHAAAALRNTEPRLQRVSACSLADALLLAFKWGNTPEGSNFWEACYLAARDSKKMPTYPGDDPEQPAADDKPAGIASRKQLNAALCTLGNIALCGLLFTIFFVLHTCSTAN